MNRSRFALLVPLLLVSSAAAAPFQAYPGPAQADPSTALFVAKGDGGITPLTWVYKIDGQTRTEFNQGVLPYGFNKTHAVGGFALSLLPGEHTFEIVLNNRRGPMAKAPAEIQAKHIRLTMKSGHSYRFTHEGFAMSVANDGKSAGSAQPAYTVEDVPVYAEPTTAAPHATIAYTRAGRDEIDPYLLRIDDAVPTAAGTIPDVNYSLPVFKWREGRAEPAAPARPAPPRVHAARRPRTRRPDSD